MCTSNRRIAGALVLIAMASAAVAQSNSSETDRRLLACSAIEHAADRLACFENVTRDISTDAPSTEPRAIPDTEAVSTATPEPGAMPSTEPVSTAAPEPVAEPAHEPAPTPAAVTTASPEPQAAPTPSASPAPVAEAGAVTSVPEATAPPARAPKKRAGDDLTGPAVVVRVTTNHDGRFTATLDNGTVWRESQGPRVGVPQEGESVLITRGVFGSYRLKFSGNSRTAWVKPKT